jgi:hypothetical protein
VSEPPFVVSGQDCVRALAREAFHLVGAHGGTAHLRRGGERTIEVPLVAALDECKLAEILEHAGVSRLRFAANLVVVRHERRDFGGIRLND